MKGTFFVSIFMAVMVLIGSVMTPTNCEEPQKEVEIEIVEVEDF